MAKTSGRGMAYTATKKSFLVSNVGAILPVSESGWERVHDMHIAVYGKKNLTVTSLFKNTLNNIH
eukprot:40128-Ditylum_brightwellii.AAC.1